MTKQDIDDLNKSIIGDVVDTKHFIVYVKGETGRPCFNCLFREDVNCELIICSDEDTLDGKEHLFEYLRK